MKANKPNLAILVSLLVFFAIFLLVSFLAESGMLGSHLSLFIGHRLMIIFALTGLGFLAVGIFACKPVLRRIGIVYLGVAIGSYILSIMVFQYFDNDRALFLPGLRLTCA